MKKWLTLTALFCAITVISTAQIQRKRNNPPADSAIAAPAGSNGMNRKDMLRELNLSKAQMQQLKESRQSLKAKKEAIDADDKLSPEEKQQQLKGLRKEQAQTMMRILTPEQRQKLMQLRQQNKAGKPMDEMDNQQ
ncbi:MAG: hypothetical protein JST86_11215 [Bacteroidetes bacterium]|nr:hypothetical protein [Bacteroidota bacterium]